MEPLGQPEEGEGIDWGDGDATLAAEVAREMATDEGLQRESDRLYERYGKPLEAEHWGEYVAIMPDGRTLLAPTLAEAVAQSSEVFGSGSFIFKVGPRITVTLLSPRLYQPDQILPRDP